MINDKISISALKVGILEDKSYDELLAIYKDYGEDTSIISTTLAFYYAYNELNYLGKGIEALEYLKTAFINDDLEFIDKYQYYLKIKKATYEGKHVSALNFIAEYYKKYGKDINVLSLELTVLDFDFFNNKNRIKELLNEIKEYEKEQKNESI